MQTKIITDGKPKLTPNKYYFEFCKYLGITPDPKNIIESAANIDFEHNSISESWDELETLSRLLTP